MSKVNSIFNKQNQRRGLSPIEEKNNQQNKTRFITIKYMQNIV